MYLIDTNVWLERLLDQQRSEEAGRFLDRTPPEHLYITDFSFHSIGVILTLLNQAKPSYSLFRISFWKGH